MPDQFGSTEGLPAHRTRDVAGSGRGDGSTWPGRVQPVASEVRISGSVFCTQCAARLIPDAAFCQDCGYPVAGAGPAGRLAAAPTPGRPEFRPAPAGRQVSQYVIATGSIRIAGWLVLGGGLALLLSTVLPWFSVLGLVSGHLPGGYLLAFLVVGALLAYLGIRALLDRVTRAVMVVQWILAAIAALAALILFVSGQYVGNRTYGIVSLGSGFYVGLIGFLATIVGTIVLQTARVHRTSAGRAG